MRAKHSVLIECILEEEAGYVAICGIRNQGDDRPDRRVSPFGNLPGRSHRGSATEAGGNSGVPGEFPCGGSRVVLGDSKNFVDYFVCKIRTLEVGSQAVDLVRIEVLAAQDCGIVGFDGEDLDTRIPLLQKGSDVAE